MFSLGFEKIADNAATGGTNNQGLEFKVSDSFNTSPNVGPGGSAPSGQEEYQPAPKSGNSKGEKKKMTPQEVGQFFMRKGASAGSRVTGRKLDNGSSEDSWTNGHKYDQSTPDSTHSETTGKIESEKKKHKAFIRAGLK